jgi:hypothetical protein
MYCFKQNDFSSMDLYKQMREGIRNSRMMFLILIAFSCSFCSRQVVINSDTSDKTIVNQEMKKGVELLNNETIPPQESFNFGFGGNGYYDMNKLVERSPKVYKLPHIKKLNYIEIDTKSDRGELKTVPIENAPVLTNYRYRLPNLTNHKIYIVCDNTPASFIPSSKEIYSLPPIYGFLLIYDTITMDADAFAIYFKEGPGKGSKRRIFRIHADRHISLEDYIENETAEFKTHRYGLTILENGKIEVIGKEDVTNRIKILDSSPQISTLPFDAHFGYSKMTELAKKGKAIYRLPPIKKMSYIPIDSAFEKKKLREGVPFETIFNFTNYRFRFPDVSGYESYFICDTTFFNYSTKCKWMGEMYATHGYLMLYKRDNQEAKVMALYFQGASPMRRTFYVDAAYNIDVQDFRVMEDDTISVEDSPTKKFRINISADAEIRINRQKPQVK